MDVYLDEFIKNKRFASRGGRRGGGRQAGNRGGNRRRGGRQAGNRGGNRRGGGGRGSTFRSNGTVGGGGEGPMRRGRIMARNSGHPYSRHPYSKGDVNETSTHDLYDGHKGQISGGLSTTNIHKIVISNLDFGVASSDIQELFEEFGPLKTATVHYDSSGRSLGTAMVVFDSQNAALKAVHQYNNVPLDGRLMKIELATNLSTVANLAMCLSRPAPSPMRGIHGGVGGNRSNNRGCGGRGGRNNEKKIPH